MKIVNDTEVFEPNECYFAVMHYPEYLGMGDDTVIAITSIDFWNDNLCLDDCFGENSLSNDVSASLEQAGISEACEATWGSDLSENDAREVMLKLGFVESSAMFEMLNR